MILLYGKEEFIMMNLLERVKRVVNKQMLLGITASLLITALLAGCSSKASTTNTAVPANTPSTEKVLRVGTETTFAPYEFKDGKKYIGFDIDLMEAIAQKIGYKMELKSVDFDELIPALETNEIDMIAAGINPTEDRSKIVIFSEPYFKDNGFITVVRKTDDTIHSMQDLANKKVITQTGTISTDMAKHIPGATVKEVKNNEDAFKALQKSETDAVIIDTVVATYYLKQDAYQDLRLAGEPSDPRGTVWAFRQDDTELRDQINQALDELKADGTYKTIYEKWFGPSEI